MSTQRKFVRSIDPAADCPDFMHHTPCPPGYLQWHEWARKMSRTHRSTRCTGCGRFVIWLPRKAKQAPP